MLGGDSSPFLGVTRSVQGRRWRLRNMDDRLALAIAQQAGLPEILGRVLAGRGVDLDLLEDHLNPSLRRMLPDPSRFRDMDAAADRIAHAIEMGEKVAVFGDYDVDGATSTALLNRFFPATGRDLRVYIPDRLKEGYGPNTPALRKLAAEGVNLEIVVFNDYVQPNVQLYEKQLDANYFQHVPYLEEFNAEKGYDLVKVAGVHIEPIGAYSEKISSIDELRDGAKIAIPNDATNGGRALALLAKHNLITLKDGAGILATVQDIVDNPKNLDIVELEAATLPRVLPDVDAAVINTNYALEAGLVPTRDALFIEDSDSPYVNILAARPDNQDDEAIRKLAAALNSDDVKRFIEETYEGAVVPAF